MSRVEEPEKFGEREPHTWVRSFKLHMPPGTYWLHHKADEVIRNVVSGNSEIRSLGEPNVKGISDGRGGDEGTS